MIWAGDDPGGDFSLDEKSGNSHQLVHPGDKDNSEICFQQDGQIGGTVHSWSTRLVVSLEFTRSRIFCCKEQIVRAHIYADEELISWPTCSLFFNPTALCHFTSLYKAKIFPNIIWRRFSIKNVFGRQIFFKLHNYQWNYNFMDKNKSTDSKAQYDRYHIWEENINEKEENLGFITNL